MSNMENYSVDDLPAAHNKNLLSFTIKDRNSDFIVTEDLGFEPAGKGDHLFLFIEKNGHTTLHVRELLAQCYGVAPLSVGYSGLKDKNAITRQWFSIKTKANEDQLFSGYLSDSDGLSVLNASRNPRKLKIGTHKRNFFEIVLRNVAWTATAKPSNDMLSHLDATLNLIHQKGVPNYFGPQRFGLKNSNLLNVQRLFAGEIKPSREKRSLYLSAARSFLFNELLAYRVKQQSWNSYLHGDVLRLSGSKSFFSIEDSVGEPAEIERRLSEKDIAIGGQLYTQRSTLVSPSMLAESLAAGLDSVDLNSHVRALAVYPTDIARDKGLQSNSPNIALRFGLEAGCFATSVLKEIGKAFDAQTTGIALAKN